MTLVHRLRLAIFAVLAVGLVIVAGTEYVGIPQRYLGQSYEVRVNLPDSGGIFPNAEVTIRGVPVGRVKSLQLTPDGVQASLRINKGVKIPADTLVKISDLSAVGEQYVNLLPQQSRGPYLSSGGSLPVSAATTPLKVTTLLVDLDRLATSIGKPELSTVVQELGKAFDNSGSDLRNVIVRARSLTQSLTALQPTTNRLLAEGGKVLGQQRSLAVPLRRLSTGLDQLTETIAADDPSLRQILDQGPSTLAATTALLQQNQANVGILLGNLLTVADVVAAPVRLAGLNTQLVLLPRIVQGTFVIQPGDGYARLGAVIDTSQAVCTNGYQSSGTPPVEGLNRSTVPGNPSLRANLNAYCANKPSSGIDVRGAANAARPPGDTTAHVIPEPNPRGFGPGSSFVNSAGGSADAATTEQPGTVRMLPPMSLSGLLLKGLG
ncbi:MAG TPA: MlaD family protein [Marmoricola sp.]|jgi:phospholipid/cholesterol/gamma-HCH transport system substrate-binding protein|nr:MlaD family protein [Marmoricola sp.]